MPDVVKGFMVSTRNLLIGLAVLVLLIIGTVFWLFGSVGGGALGTPFGSCVGEVQLAGEISFGTESGLFGEGSTTEDTLQNLKEMAADRQVSSILLRVNSPGGSAAASKELYEQILEVGRKKPVLAYMEEIGASGGYYAASAADVIVANPNALTGSIGARWTYLNYQGLFEKLGLHEESLKSGELKDIGAGYRNLTDKERQVLQDILKDSFDRFVQDVRYARGNRLNPARFAEVLDGRVLTAQQALAAGLIDGMGSREQAKRQAAALGNLTVAEGEPVPVCYPPEHFSLRELFTQLSLGSVLNQVANRNGWQLDYR